MKFSKLIPGDWFYYTVTTETEKRTVAFIRIHPLCYCGHTWNAMSLVSGALHWFDKEEIRRIPKTKTKIIINRRTNESLKNRSRLRNHRVQ